jgi:hypothetical protein
MAVGLDRKPYISTKIAPKKDRKRGFSFLSGRPIIGTVRAVAD